MEKGWTSKYSVTSDAKKETEDPESEDEGVGEDEQETTYPETGLNMWFVYDKVEDIENLHKVCRIWRLDLASIHRWFPLVWGSRGRRSYRGGDDNLFACAFFVFHNWRPRKFVRH